MTERVKNVEGDNLEMKVCIADIKKSMGEMRDSIAELRLDVVDKISGRPTWAVTVIITVLSSLSLSLIVYVITSAAMGGS